MEKTDAKHLSLYLSRNDPKCVSPLLSSSRFLLLLQPHVADMIHGIMQGNDGQNHYCPDKIVTICTIWRVCVRVCVVCRAVADLCLTICPLNKFVCTCST